MVTTNMSQVLHWSVLSGALSLALASGCESQQIELVETSETEHGDFGRSALLSAVALLSESPTSESAYAQFAESVASLQSVFNQRMRQDADLRLNILALGPLQEGFYTPAGEQMERFATTVWPTILDFPANQDESAQTYVQRLCQSKLAFACRNLVPEYWPVMINAHVWRALNSRTLVAYGRCQWCEKDESFSGILSGLKESHLQAELLAQRITRYGSPSAWPREAGHSEPLRASLVVSFESDGLVRVGDEQPSDGNWRQEIADKRHEKQILGVHFLPSRQVGELLSVVDDIEKAGYSEVALIVRKRVFPYQKRQYGFSAQLRSFAALGVERTDSLQVLVQALDNARRND